MKKNLLWFLGGVVLASVILICFGLRLVHLTKPAEEEIVRHSKEQMTEKMNKVEDKYLANAVELREQADGIISEMHDTIVSDFITFHADANMLITETRDSIISRLYAIQSENNSLYARTCDSVVAELDSIYHNANNIIEATQGILFARKESARKSYEEAVRVKSKDMDLAKIYILNAINHEPSNIQYLGEYYSMVSANDKATYDDFDNASSLLSSCIYQVDHDNIATLKSWIDALDKKQESILASNENNTQKEVSNEIKSKYDNIKKKSVKTTCASTAVATDLSNAIMLQEEMESFMLEVADDARYENYYQDILKSYKELSNQIEVINVAKQCETQLSRSSTAIIKEQYDLAMDYLSIFETLFFQINSMEDIDKILPTNWLYLNSQNKAKQLSDINKNLSNKEFKEVKNLVDRGLVISVSGKYQDAILKIQDLYIEANSHLTKISDSDISRSAQIEIMKLSDKISKYQERQHQEYQKWASRLVLDLQKLYDDKNLKKAEKVMEYIKNRNPYNVTNIDQRYLIPEISSVLRHLTDDVLFEKLDETQKREFNKEFMNATKRSLEDF